MHVLRSFTETAAVRKLAIKVGLAAVLAFGVVTAAAHAQIVQTTAVTGTVYAASGAPVSGTLQVSWPAFTTAAGQAIAAGHINVTIPADGKMQVALAPNVGASPAGLYYTAIYHLADGTTSTEYWVVPNSMQTTIGQIRAKVMPAAQAVQAVSKTYVDQSIQAAVSSQITPSGGTMTGPLYLAGDPMAPNEASTKHYVDTSVAGSLPLGGGTLSGPLTATKIGAVYQVDQFPGADFGAQLQACVKAVDPVYGGTCDARNFQGSLTMSANLTIATGNITINLPCSTIATAASIVVPGGTRNVTLHGCASRGTSAASGTEGGTVFLYSGSSSLLAIGDPSFLADTKGFRLDNAALNTTASTAASAQGIAFYRTQEISLASLYLLGNGNQTGITVDGTGNYAGGTLEDLQITGFQNGLSGIGHTTDNAATTDWMNASTLIRLHVTCPTSNGNPMAGTIGINLNAGDGNTITGGDVEGCGTALHLGSNAVNNTILGLRNENSTTQIQADKGSSYNNWITGGTMFTGKLVDQGTRNSFLDTFHRSFNELNGDWWGSQQDATTTNHFRLGTGTGTERGMLSRYQTDYGYRWTTGLSDASSGEQYYQVLDELNGVQRLQIGQYLTASANTVTNVALNSGGCYGSNTAPTLTIAGGGGSGAAGTANLVSSSCSGGYTVGSVTMTNGGSGYSAQPVVSWSEGNQISSPSAVAEISTAGSTDNQTVINAAGSGAIVLNGSTNAGTGGVVIGSGGPVSTTVATIDKSGNAHFTGTLLTDSTAQSTGTMTVRNNADAEVDYYLWPGLTASQKGSFTYKDFTGASQWYMVKDQNNNWALNSALGGIDSFKAYQSTNSGDTYINASNAGGTVRVNYETGSGAAFNIYGGNSSTLYAGFTAANAIKFPGLAAASARNCLQIDTSGYLSNTGGPCGNGAGTVNTGTAGQIAYYSASGAALSGTTTVSVTAGGTGAATAAGALTNLGALALTGGTVTGTLGVRNNADAEVDYTLQAGATAAQKAAFVYKDFNGNNQWYVLKDASNNLSVNSGVGGLDSFKAYQSTNSGDTYINAANATGHIRLNYEAGSGAETDIYSSSSLAAAILSPTSIKLPGLAAAGGKNCLQIDSSGYISNTTAPCAGSTGTVNTGATGQIAYYLANGTAVSGMNSVPLTAGGTGAATAAGALSNLGGLPLAGGTVTGQLTAAQFNGPLTGNVTGNLSGNVTGNLTGNVTGTAANVTGTVALANGGTGAATAAGALSNLGGLSLAGGTVTGQLTAAQFNGPLAGNVTGNVTGSVTGNVAGNVTGTAANVTGTVAVTNGGTGATTAAGALANLLPGIASDGSNGLSVQGSAVVKGNAQFQGTVAMGNPGVTFADNSVQTTSQQGALTGAANDATARGAAAQAEADAQSGLSNAAAAQTTANSALNGQANDATARGVAAQAEADAQTAGTNAAAAQTTANSALNGQASDATARGVAAQAEADAQTAGTNAAAAQTTANGALNGQASDATARGAAAQAEADAQSGLSNAAAAQTTANSALNGQANDATARGATAQAAADAQTAGTNAAAAQATAAQAATDAQSAVTTANTAQTSAAQASSDAQTAAAQAAAAAAAAQAAAAYTSMVGSLPANGATSTGTGTTNVVTFPGTVAAVTSSTTGSASIGADLNVSGVLSGGAVVSAAGIRGYSWSQLQALGQVQLAGYNAGSRLGAGVFRWTSVPTTPDNCVYFAGSDDPAGTHGVMARVISDYVYPEMCGSYADATYYTVSIAKGSSVLFGSNFTASMAGMKALIPAAGASGKTLVATITGYTNSTQLTLSVAAGTAAAGVAALIGTDDTPFLQAWAKLNQKKSMQRVTYIVSNTININGDSSNPLTNTRQGMFAPIGATIEEITDDVPIMTVFSNRSSWRFPRLLYANAQAASNLNAVGLLVDPYPGQGGLYICDEISMKIENAAVGFFNPPSVSSTIPSGASLGDTSVTVANAQTNALGNFPWMKQMWVQIRLHGGAWFPVRISNVGGTILTLTSALPDSVDANAPIVFSMKAQSGSVVGLMGPADYSNNFTDIYIVNPSLAGYVDRSVGTHNEYSNFYVTGNLPPAGDNLNWPTTATNAIYIAGSAQNHFGIVNVEHLKLTGSAIIYYSGGAAPVFDSIHFEGDRLTTSGTGLIEGHTNSMIIGSLELNYCSMISDDGITNVAILMPSNSNEPGVTTSWIPRGKWKIGSLTTQKNIVTFSANAGSPVAFLVKDNSGSSIDIEIDEWNTMRDGGFYPAGQLVTPAGNAAPWIGNKMPRDTVAYGLRLGMATLAAQRLYAGAGSYNVNKILVANGSKWVNGTPAGGIYQDAALSTLMTSSNSLPLAVGSAATAVVLPLASGAQNTMLNNLTNSASFLLTAASTTSTVTTSTSTWLTGRNAGDNQTNLAYINFTSAHGLTAGQDVTIAGSANPGLSGSVHAYVVDVPSSTQIVLYVDSATCTITPPATTSTCGTSGSPIPESGLTITVNPVADVFVMGDKVS